MRLLITGSSGMLGQSLLETLKKEYELIGLDVRHSSGIVPPNLLKCDITGKSKVIEDISKAKPDVVIHAAALTDVDRCELDGDLAYRVNGLGTENVAEACKLCGAHMVYMSTDFVFDGGKDKPYTEEDKPNSINKYGLSKLKGELFVKKILSRFLILRTSWMFGKGGRNFVDTILLKAKTGEEIKVVNDQYGSPTFAKDMAEAIRRLLGCSSGKKSELPSGICHITNSGVTSWFEFAGKILEFSGLANAKLFSISSSEVDRPAPRPRMSALDNSKFKRLTGHLLRPWQEALREYVKEA